MSSRRLAGILITVLFASGFLYKEGVLGQFLPAKETTGVKIVDVVDGDTVDVLIDGKEQTVRMIGIDTPETKRPGVPVECGGPEASAAMDEILSGKMVTLKTDPTQDEVDRYGRMLAYVYLPSGETAQEEILSRGLATVYVYGGRDFRLKGDFDAAQRQAEETSEGVWGLCGGDFHSAS